MSFTADLRGADGDPWLTIADGWFDLALENTTDVLFTPQHRSFRAIHDDSTRLECRFRRIPTDKFIEWGQRFLDKEDMVARLPDTIDRWGAIDPDGMVPVMEFEGVFRTPEVAVRIAHDVMELQVHLPGFEERIADCGSWIVGGDNRVKLVDGAQQAFFSLG